MYRCYLTALFLPLHQYFRIQVTVIFGDPNQNPFGNQQSIAWGGNDSDPNSKTIRLRDRLNEADTDRRKAEEEAMQRERAAEIRREERMRKIAYMEQMPDNQPAGTGEYRPSYNQCFSFICVI